VFLNVLASTRIFTVLPHGFDVLRFIPQYQNIIFKMTPNDSSDPETSQRT